MIQKKVSAIDHESGDLVRLASAEGYRRYSLFLAPRILIYIPVFQRIIIRYTTLVLIGSMENACTMIHRTTTTQLSRKSNWIKQQVAVASVPRYTLGDRLS